MSFCGHLYLVIKLRICQLQDEANCIFETKKIKIDETSATFDYDVADKSVNVSDDIKFEFYTKKKVSLMGDSTFKSIANNTFKFE